MATTIENEGINDEKETRMFLNSYGDVYFIFASFQQQNDLAYDLTLQGYNALRQSP